METTWQHHVLPVLATLMVSIMDNPGVTVIVNGIAMDAQRKVMLFMVDMVLTCTGQGDL